MKGVDRNLKTQVGAVYTKYLTWNENPCSPERASLFHHLMAISAVALHAPYKPYTPYSVL